MILRCTCQHETQDEFHGKGNRVFNPMKGGERARCTVCGATKMLSDLKTTNKKEKK